MIAPHAGHRYSGPVAGHAFAAVRGLSPKLVAVISPMHSLYHQPILTSGHEAYQTPLGSIPIDHDAVSTLDEQLQKSLGLGLTQIREDQEHSLEIELPFLQCAIKGGFNLIPIMIRDQSRTIAQTLGEILGEELQGESCLLVASSDLSHFYPETTANQLDNRVLAALEKFSPEGLFDLKDQGKGHACGLAAIASVLWSARKLGGKDVTLLCYDTSASTTGDTSSVVGYGAAVVTRPA